MVFITANANYTLLSLTSFNGYVRKITASTTDVPLAIIILQFLIIFNDYLALFALTVNPSQSYQLQLLQFAVNNGYN